MLNRRMLSVRQRTRQEARIRPGSSEDQPTAVDPTEAHGEGAGGQ